MHVVYYWGFGEFKKSNLKSLTIFEKVQKNLTFSGCVVDLKMILESEDE